MRTKAEIIKDLNQVQSLCDRLTMEIGLGYVRSRAGADMAIVTSVNQKIEAYKKAEAQSRALEQELAGAKD